MATAAFLAIVGRLPGLAHRRLLLGMILALAVACALAPAPAAAQGRAAPPAELKQITNDLYFFYEFAGSNAVFMVTDEGVLVIDTRTHPRHGQALLDMIRKVTDKPIKWVINSHFHGDHHFGNAPFRPSRPPSWRRLRPRASCSMCRRRKWRAASMASRTRISTRAK
jgi:glyoxylase-like metal-dependent hydrolase (beta-lactamase superfamily II)